MTQGKDIIISTAAPANKKTRMLIQVRVFSSQPGSNPLSGRKIGQTG